MKSLKTKKYLVLSAKRWLVYSVIACSECECVQIVEGKPQRTECNRCRKSLDFSKVRKFHQVESLEEARRARASLMAKMNGLEDEFVNASEEGFDVDLDRRIGEDELLENEGIKEEVEEVGSGRRKSKSKKERVVGIIEELEEPARDDVIGRAREWGISRSYAEKTLEKLIGQGEVVEKRDGTIKLV